MNLGLGAGRIHDLIADVAGSPDFVHLDAIARIDSDLRHLREVARVTVVAREAVSVAGCVLASCPARFLGHQLQHAFQAIGVERVVSAATAWFGDHRELGVAFSNPDVEVERIAARCRCDLVNERP